MPPMSSRVICFGELLIDFVSTESGVTLADAPAFKKAPGGAPANVAVGLAKLGVPTGFMGKVGEDDFGHFLAGVLADNGVDTSGLSFSDAARTALAFVSLRADGEREFMFYRHPSADMLFEAADVDEGAIHHADIFHFGSITFISEPSRSATLHAVEAAHRGDTTVSYDPNLRLNLWPDAETAKAGMMLGWPEANLLKVSREELAFLTGKDDVRAGVKDLWHNEIRLLLVTDGMNGAWYFTPSFMGHVPGFKVATVDTTGAGDGFMAGILSRWLADPDLLQSEDAIREAVRFGNAAGALATTARGAIPALPGPQQVEALLND